MQLRLVRGARLGLVVLLGLLVLGAWFDVGPFGRLWPAQQGVASSREFAHHVWAPGRQTAILVLSTPCESCLQNTGFYQTLTKASPGKFDVIATFDTSVSDGTGYLKALDISVSQVIHASRRSLGVESLPTLLLVDDIGRERRRWEGILNSLQRAEIAEALGFGLPAASAAVPSASLRAQAGSAATPLERQSVAAPSVNSLKDALDDPGQLVIVDSRPRSEFGLSHLDGSINIPYDELTVRIPHEIDTSKNVFVFCDHCRECEKAISKVASRDLCRRTLDELRSLGFPNAVVIDATLKELNAAGVRVVPGAR
jgi:rhodanese-related sulfurtransferase